MSVRLSAVRRAAPFVLVLPLLFGCSPGPDQFAPVCPEASVLPDTGHIVLYRNNSAVHDLTDVVLQGQVIAIKGQCSPGDHKDRLAASVAIAFSFTRGPAMRGNTLSVPAFVAVTEGDRILDKKVYRVAAHFPPNLDTINYESAPVDLSLPITATKTGSAYTILAGFQLTRSQLATNRAQGGQ